ncbi:hypothetical protein ATT74_25900 [Salmonella enterica subsp. enterica serovar Panama]|uniref:Uncharacterized protein n=1 Tax=Salmonella enterica subsp. enterica serovar Panama TaxID=29472 RepID=A0A619AM11_SALET|nr:hypothetical protein [Salmonella enterica subsp. enterica serovar Amager]EBW4032854.1 hypothetical protein [Salmonella enterica subsp. enterica serovar Newport]ECT5253007.1 hypothetical protein [Salmonella enterica subsp. enterica serovar Panama]EGU5383833.1 hypothetical protein [Salmonella enterica]EBV5221272.1 hypothetical protein [Salmonella enterica subsp. enterica serovar Amager]
MPTFLVRDYISPTGYCELTITTKESDILIRKLFVPWAATCDCLKVIYARHGEHRGFNSGYGLRRYDTFVSQQRQRFCTSELGFIALNGMFTQPSVNIVSSGVKKYLLRYERISTDCFKRKVFQDIAHYFYTNGGMGYGRISLENKNNIGIDGVWNGILNALDNGSLEQQLAIHDAVGRKLLITSTLEKKRYDFWGGEVREEWFNDKEKRGRKESNSQKNKEINPTVLPGILAVDIPRIGSITQSRNRGVDMFTRDLSRKHDPNADSYYDEADCHNLVFGAGISGTAGTLLQTAYAFGGFSDGELLKQYTLAIIAYLIGGGMHSYHEVMAIAKRVGIFYTQPGSFDWLPLSFKRSPVFYNWREKYYDIVVLGATHWRFNSGSLPSHLNQALKN